MNEDLSNINLEQQAANNEEVVLSEAEELEYMLFFRTCVVDRDMEILKIKLSQTIALREKSVKKATFHKAFPFYFVRPELVSVKFFFFDRS